jgi:hypothetical protein
VVLKLPDCPPVLVSGQLPPPDDEDELEELELELLELLDEELELLLDDELELLLDEEPPPTTP